MALLSLLDPLYCQEESLELEEERMEPMPTLSAELETDRHLIPSAAAEEEDWAEVLRSLDAKEREIRPEMLPDGAGDDACLLTARREAVEWVARAAAGHAFSVLTALLAVNYLDRCFLSYAAAGWLGMQRDKPWMGRLAAVACLSLAAKVEETRVPLLLDLQVAAPPKPEEESEYVFEAQTVRRMELLVLSALGWRMNPATPLSFIHHLLPRLCSNARNGISTTTSATPAASIRDLINECEAALLAVIADWRWVRYPASVWAAAALLHAAEGGGVAPATASESLHLISLLDIPKEKVEECYKIITGTMAAGGGGGTIGHKRKHSSSSFSYNYYYSPPSPNGLIGSYFSCESSSINGDSWEMWPSSVSSSPEIRHSKLPNCTANKAFGDEGTVEDELLASV